MRGYTVCPKCGKTIPIRWLNRIGTICTKKGHIYFHATKNFPSVQKWVSVQKIEGV